MLRRRLATGSVAFECPLFQAVPLSTKQFIAIGRIVSVVLNAATSQFDTPRLKLIGGMHTAKW